MGKYDMYTYFNFDALDGGEVEVSLRPDPWGDGRTLVTATTPLCTVHSPDMLKMYRGRHGQTADSPATLILVDPDTGVVVKPGADGGLVLEFDYKGNPGGRAYLPHGVVFKAVGV